MVQALMAMVNFCDDCLRKKEEGECVQTTFFLSLNECKVKFVNHQNTRTLDITNIGRRD